MKSYVQTITEKNLIHNLSDLLNPISLTDFIANYWGKEYCYIKGDDAKFKHLFSWELLNRILLTHRLDYPRIRLIRNGELLNPATYLDYKNDRRGSRYSKVNSEKLNQELFKGTAIHISSVEEFNQEIKFLTEKIEKELLTKIEATIHIGLNESKGFHPHFDAHDVFVLQVSGRKKWKIYGFIENHPIRVGPSIKSEISKEPIWEAIIEQGDLLYLPRGMWHSAEALVEPSLHISIGMTNPMSIDYLLWLADNLKALEIIRTDIPSLLSESEKNIFIEKIRSILSETINIKSLNAFIQNYTEKSPVKEFNLPKIQ